MNITFPLNSSNPPFGMVMPGRNWQAASSNGYGFGFNGKLKDDEINGKDKHLDFGASHTTDATMERASDSIFGYS